ncbi:MAG: BRO family protein [Sphingobacteriaceae bacterium]
MSLIRFDNNSVRTIELDQGGIGFNVKDVCAIIGLANHRDAIADIPDRHKVVARTDTVGGQQNMAYVSEAGLYSLIFKSRKEEAERFKWFVFETIIPEYRKAQENKFIEALRERDEIIEEQDARIEAYHELHNEAGSMCMREATIILKEYFYDVNVQAGRNDLFAFLRMEGILDNNNLPYQTHADKFVVIRQNGQTTVRLKNTKLTWLKKYVAKRMEKKFISRSKKHLINSFKF